MITFPAASTTPIVFVFSSRPGPSTRRDNFGLDQLLNTSWFYSSTIEIIYAGRALQGSRQDEDIESRRTKSEIDPQAVNPHGGTESLGTK